MNCFSLHNYSGVSYTQISNTFIDEYMPSANGTYVKVYLMLLRIMSSGATGATISGIADVLDVMYNDVLRAFNYWEKQSLINIERDCNGVITDVTITPASVSADVSSPSNISVVFNTQASNTQSFAGTRSFVNTSDTAGICTAAEPAEKKAPDYSPDALDRIADKDEFRWITDIVEKYMEKPLQLKDVELLAYIYDTLAFSPDLIFHLYEYCISHGKKNNKYIQTVAVNWAKEGIDSVEKAEAQSARFDSDYMDVMRAFGINQPPAPAQKQCIDSWLSYGFSPDIIREACNRTILAINEPNFKYAGGILENWHKLGVKSLDDIIQADKIHSKTMDNPSQKSAKQTKRKNSSRQTYEQRNYSPEESDVLERQLLRRNI